MVLILIRASLKTKFLLLTSTLLFLAVLTYLILAINLFREDKTAYIYEGNATLVSTLSAEVETNFKSLQKAAKLMALTVNQNSRSTSTRKSALKKAFDQEDEIVYFAIYPFRKQAKPIEKIYRSDFLKPYNKKRNYYDQVIQKFPIPFGQLTKSPLIIQNSSLSNGIPLLSMSLPYSSRGNGIYDQIIFTLLRQDRRVRLFSRSESFTTSLINKYGEVLAHPDSQNILKHKSLANDPMFKKIINSPAATAVKTTSSKNGDIIFGYSRLATGDLLVLSEIPKDRAFLASQRLIEKSILFAILILAISFVVNLIFSKRLTSSITSLYAATQEIMRGNFAINVAIKSNDEVGALGESFNKMTGEISRLLEETADKARMEKELETAHIVQDNFFPIDQLELSDYELAAFFRPASECGGDWWGQFRIRDKLVILIGDATGHGVPAALITAAAQSCCTTLESLNEEFPDIKLTSSLILEKLNTSIYRASKGTVKMTFFAALLDLKSGDISYSNASHDMPMICHIDPDNPDANRSKKDIEICKGKTGLILGQELGSTYQEHQTKLMPGEVLALFTDGILECKNEEEQMFGKGRFLRNYSKIANENAIEIRDHLVKTAMDFFGEKERDDDLTLVIVKRKLKAQEQTHPQAS